MHVVGFLKSDHSDFSTLWWNIELQQKQDFGTSDFHLCGQRFLKNYTAEFNKTRHNNYIEGVVDARGSIIKI